MSDMDETPFRCLVPSPLSFRNSYSNYVCGLGGSGLAIKCVVRLGHYKCKFLNGGCKLRDSRLRTFDELISGLDKHAVPATARVAAPTLVQI
jgi:hypothetical protein